ncbi:MAG: hypothetical protein Q9208_000345 [Pyrenodesmia sp. 3 TL-2023]
MRSFIASAALVAGVAATHGSNGTAPIQYTTEILTAYTTFCPAATQITHGAETYTVTEAPVVPATSAVETHVSPVETHVSPVETHVSPVETHVTPVAPIGTGSPAQPPFTQPIFVNSTVPAGPTGSVPGAVIPGVAGPSGTAAPSGTGSSPVAPFQGAAPKMAASGASLAGLLGLAAFFL